MPEHSLTAPIPPPLAGTSRRRCRRAPQCLPLRPAALQCAPLRPIPLPRAVGVSVSSFPIPYPSVRWVLGCTNLNHSWGPFPEFHVEPFTAACVGLGQRYAGDCRQNCSCKTLYMQKYQRQLTYRRMTIIPQRIGSPRGYTGGSPGAAHFVNPSTKCDPHRFCMLDQQFGPSCTHSILGKGPTDCGPPMPKVINLFLIRSLRWSAARHIFRAC